MCVCVGGGGLTSCPPLDPSMHIGLLNFLVICLFDFILYVPLTIFKLYRDESSWVEPVIS